MGKFTARGTREDKTWARLRLTQFCPELPVTHQRESTTDSAEKPQDLLAMLKLSLDQRMAVLVLPEKTGNSKEGQEDIMEGTWEKKLGLSKTALANMLRFCGLKEGEEDCLPHYLKKLAEKNNTKGDKDSIIQKVLSKSYYADADVPITAVLLAVIREGNWTGGESTCTIANCMKGLSIFAMRDFSDEAVSIMNEEEEAKDRATSTSVKDHLDGNK